MMRTRAVWMLGLAALLAGAAVFLAQNWLKAQPSKSAISGTPMTGVVVASKRLDFGTVIRKEHLRLIPWPAQSLPKGVFRSIDELIKGKERRVALRQIEVNEPVLKSKVSGFGGRATLSAVISEAMRAVTIRVNDVNGVAGFVLPGDRVDVIITRNPNSTAKVTGRGGSGGLVTNILLQNVKVLATDQDLDQDTNKPSVAKAVTLEVTAIQAQKLVLAQKVGQLSLALRNINNTAAAEGATVTLSDLRLGEVNSPNAAASREKHATRKTAVKRAVRRTRNPLASVKITRGTELKQYRVMDERTSGAASHRRPSTPTAQPKAASDVRANFDASPFPEPHKSDAPISQPVPTPPDTDRGYLPTLLYPHLTPLNHWPDDVTADRSSLARSPTESSGGAND